LVLEDTEKSALPSRKGFFISNIVEVGQQQIGSTPIFHLHNALHGLKNKAGLFDALLSSNLVAANTPLHKNGIKFSEGNW